MEEFINRHRALILKLARAHVRESGEKISLEDLAREMELVLLQLGRTNGLKGDDIVAPDAYFRGIVRHAGSRAKRRHTLIQQVAAGDDLHAVSDDLAALDADLPSLPAAPDDEAKEARRQLDALKAALSPLDRLIFSLLLEDDSSEESVAATLGQSEPEIRDARDRILAVAAEVPIQGHPDPRGASPEAQRESMLRDLARRSGTVPITEGHVPEPILALIRNGDFAEDIHDAIAHTAFCVDCRARLTEGEIERRSLVVMAIEAPRGSQVDLAQLTEGSGARLHERGEGRWMAVVDADRAHALKGRLEPGEASVVTRLAVATPIDVPLDPPEKGGPKMRSYPEILPAEKGTDAAEVAAWVQVRHAPRRPSPPQAGWVLFAIAAVILAITIAYVLATR